MRRIRLAALGLHHESNSFALMKTDLDSFEAAGVFRGDEIRTTYAKSATSMAGFLDIDSSDIAVKPLIYSFPNPSGPITTHAFEVLCGEAMQLLRDKGPWDGVLLAQHGAAVCESFPDADAEVARRVRQVVGESIPIGVALDLHGNVSIGLMENVDVVVGYRTNPHADARTRAKECAELLLKMIRGEIHPVQALVTVAAVPTILVQATDSGVMHSIYQAIDDALTRPGILSASIFQGFPYSDVGHMGMACIAIHDGDAEVALSGANYLASRIWEFRESLVSTAMPPAEAVRQAAASASGPIVLLDVGDNIGAGGTGDSPVLLELALENSLSSYLQSVCDPDSVIACSKAGPGGHLQLTIGRRGNRSHWAPIEVAGDVVGLHPGPFEDKQPTHGGIRFFDPGLSAAFRCDGGQMVVFHSKLMMNISLMEYLVFGIDPRAFRVVVAKGVNAPRLAYSAIAADMILVDTPGAGSADLGRLPYRSRRVPMFPFEREVPEPMVEWCGSRTGST
jgi:microcystin degradation protein MlrC